MMRERVRILLGATIIAAMLHGIVWATPTPKGTPCSAPEFQKVGEFIVPACGAPRGDVTKLNGRIVVSNRMPPEILQAMLIRKGKVLALAAITAAADQPNAAEISFEFAESSVSYQVPIDLVIVPKCGPVLSISVDRPGRCG